MPVLYIDLNYYKFPQNVSSIDEFILYANQHYNSFIPLIQYQTENCAPPYLIEEETKTVYINVATMAQVCTEEVTIIPTRKEYDDKLKQVVQKKCINCTHYEEDSNGDDLSGHRDRLTLDGECWLYEEKDI